jgi:Rps23 Pro-64 3,4-dihydroxylase Tpa1-like proline 4-hydroxylase
LIVSEAGSLVKYQSFFTLTLIGKKGDGGELKVYLKDKEELISPSWGKLVIFKSDELEHEVLPTNINRFSVCGWLRYDEFGKIGAFPKAFF